MGAAISLFIIVALGILGLYLIFGILKNLKPGRNKIQGDLAKIKSELQPWVADLVPWSEEEMEQLSLNQINRKSKKRVSLSSKGMFTTIYHEPVIAWAYKKYIGSKENALIYARTTEHEFIYRIKNGAVEIVANDKIVGTLDVQGRIRQAKGNNLLAQINRESDGLLLPVLVNGKQVGSLTNPSKNQKSNSRAFQLVSKMGKEEEEVFLALGILEMVRQGV